MQINEKIKEELEEAISSHGAGSFEITVSGGLKHFISSEGQARGLYILTIVHGKLEFKIYMI
jgi:hypothetical protein